jgi:hypothetical protein
MPLYTSLCFYIYVQGCLVSCRKNSNREGIREVVETSVLGMGKSQKLDKMKKESFSRIAQKS